MGFDSRTPILNINISISFLCSCGNGRTKNSKNGIPMRVSGVDEPT